MTTTTVATTVSETTTLKPATTDSSETTEATSTPTSEVGSAEPDAGLTSEAASSGDVTSGPDTRDVDCDTVVVNAKLGKIATVGVVTFSADFHIDSANVEFAPVGTDTFVTAPVDLNEPNYKTYLLGMKQAKDYVFRLVIHADGKTCTSEDQTLTTGVLEREVFFERVSESVGTRGFFMSNTFGQSKGDTMYIFDTDGDLVWAQEGVAEGSRARLDWNTKNMWSIVAQSGTPRVRRASLDGEELEDVTALATAHHDLTVLPNGHIAVIAYGDPVDFASDPCMRVVDYDPVTKTTRNIVADVATLFQPIEGCHTNALSYQEHTNTFIISDLNVNLYVKFSAADGAPIWQLGGVNPIAPQLSGGDQVWTVSHGHHLMEDGRFVFFNNYSPSGAAVREFHLDEAAGTASGGDYFSDDDGFSDFLGDVQILKNGNLWVTYSQVGVVREYDSSRQILADFHVDVGYSYFMESLYEKPYGK